MNHEHDHVVLKMILVGTQRFFLSHENVALDWPPPKRIFFDDKKLREAREGDAPEGIFTRIRMSQLTDEQMKKIPHVARGAEYKYEAEYK